MKRDIKDYLHLYLQSEATFSKEFVHDIGSWTAPVRITPDRYRMMDDASISGIKLYLRPLSDMTDEEIDDVWYMNEPAHVLTMEYKRDTNVRRVSLCSERTRYLLSKGFDLFQLIEAGLAIDKTTLKQES